MKLVCRSLTLALLVSPAWIAGCTSIVHEDTYWVPASIYRDHDPVKPGKHGRQPTSLDNTIFRPGFVQYLASILEHRETLDANQVMLAASHWNSVLLNHAEHVEFDQQHFIKIASLSTAAASDCIGNHDCVVNRSDIDLLLKWYTHPLPEISATNDEHGLARDQLHSLYRLEHAALGPVLKKLDEDPLGHVLLRNAYERGVKIELDKLKDKHGYYDIRRNRIILDHKVAQSEFNLRYLVHELVHALNQRHADSIEEEVLAEWIGIQVQNRLTGVEFREQSYTLYVSHLLHPYYGKMPLQGSMIEVLQNAGLAVR